MSSVDLHTTQGGHLKRAKLHNLSLSLLKEWKLSRKILPAITTEEGEDDGDGEEEDE